MKRLSVDLNGILMLDGKPVQAVPVGEPKLATEWDLERFCQEDQKDGANAFLQGKDRVEKEIPGPYEVYSKAARRTIVMDGPRVEPHWPVQFYRINS